VGDVSYSIYLWHWPLLVILPFVTHHPLRWPEKIGVAAMSLGAGWLTKLAIEDPVRNGPVLRSRPTRYTFVATAGGMAVVLLIVNGGQAALQRQIARWDDEAAALLASHPRCFGAAAHDPTNRCVNRALDKEVVPAPIAAADTGNAPCKTLELTGLVRPCRFGVPVDTAQLSFVMLGDSHAAHWRTAFAPIANEREWHGLTISRSGCPFSAAVKVLPEPFRSQCIAWNHDVYRWFAKHPEVTVVFVAQISGSRVEVPDGGVQFDEQARGYREAWAELPPTVTRIVVMRDTPKMHSSTKVCVQQALDSHARAAPACDVKRQVALRPDPAVAAAGTSGSDRVSVLDMSEYLCSEAACPAVIGGALVYKDIHHLTAVFALTLSPLLARKFDALGL
jgi:hypothetical protein